MSKQPSVKITAPDGTEYDIKDLLTVKKLQELFQLKTIVTVYNWLGRKSEDDSYPDGKFPHAFKMGKIYIPIMDVKDMIQRRKSVL